MIVKNQLNQSENEIYCHNSSVNLPTCPMRFILLTHYTIYTGYPQKSLHPIPYSFLVEVLWEKHHCIIHFATMAVHSLEGARSELPFQNYPPPQPSPPHPPFYFNSKPFKNPTIEQLGESER